nr:HMG protein(MNB1b) [Zea mays]
HEGGQI